MRKMNIVGNKFYINSKKSFIGKKVKPEFIEKSFDFAYNMSFGSEGQHRNYRSGGRIRRRNGEIFINTFQGKIAEHAIYQYFTSSNIIVPEPDIGTFDLGVWDSYDFLINGCRIAVKSTKYYGNLLLLETADWNEWGEYIPNIGTEDSIYDYFILVRIYPDGEQLMRKKRKLYSDTIEKRDLYNLVVSDKKWEFDIPGFISREDLICIIRNHYIIPQNSMLNGKIEMDAENYYVQAGDMRNINNILPILR